MVDPESADEKAIRLLRQQLEAISTIRGLNYMHAEFKVWRDTTIRVLEKFLGPGSPHTVRFRDTRFSRPPRKQPYGVRVNPYQSQADRHTFVQACETAEATLKAAIKDIQEFGVYVEQARPADTGSGSHKGGGVSQTFHGPVTIHNQAIATDHAVQNIGQIGDLSEIGDLRGSLREIAELMQQSEDLTVRQVKEGLARIEALAMEVQKPETNRDWKSIFEYGQSVLDIASKATDLAHKLAPFTPAVVSLMEMAKHML